MRNATAPKPPSFAALVQQFFTEYLVAQRALSPRTVDCYRDALMLFLEFAGRKLGKAPTALRLADIQSDLILAFLDHLEHERHNAVRSRNLRLTALRTFLKFAGRRDLSSLHAVERALAVPMKRFERPLLGFLTREEMLAVLGQPGSSWTSQRDHLLLAMLYNALLPNRDGRAMCRSNVTQRLDLAVGRASAQVPSILKKPVSPHTLRHTTAMHLLQSGVPFNVIALWLGHESTTTTHRYVEADLAMKERALARLEEPDTKMRRFRPPDPLMRFLQTL